MQSAGGGSPKVPAGTFVEFQVIVLTNDESHFASELCEGTCKGLIKISNRCLIYFILRNLIEQKLRYISIVVNAKYYDEMVSYVKETFPENCKVDDKKGLDSYCIDVEPYTSANNEELGPVQCLLQMRHKIKSDFIIVNCDILGFVDFHSLANLFRGENAICALLLLEENQTDTERKKQKEKDELLNLENNIWVCIDRNSKVVSMKDSLSMKQSGRLKISKINLAAHRNFILKTDLLDSHVYIFKNYVLDILERKSAFTSIKYDLIPYLIKIQNTRRAAEYYAKSEFQFHMYKTLVNKHEQLKNVLPPYCFFLMSDKNQSYKDCIISSHFEHEENVVLKKSVLGKNVKIKKNSSVSRSILMDNITVSENCHIQNSIICKNVLIEENCKLVDCIVKENSVIERNGTFEKETLPLFIS
ncbi:hypothetical protein PVMG_00287 [Plasmodium vivax Mauritania I]|uniref:Translation initiation factor eIF2B subunit gamma n=3 Tax=Plasmodium vivax TaxID=5855 RepID=A0A0J9VUY7_PLAVI|nr:hypothetical protein PVBG_02224 [Plasmodium vivax Brazil I]KMZ91413.1 hypothetical protein PVMG_00287 [Plasmodium vivax Mauritania I]KMZ98218.1 hypothetical protein PVNG_06037 [Plasmodium vivax North Korean]